MPTSAVLILQDNGDGSVGLSSTSEPSLNDGDSIVHPSHKTIQAIRDQMIPLVIETLDAQTIDRVIRRVADGSMQPCQISLRAEDVEGGIKMKVESSLPILGIGHREAELNPCNPIFFPSESKLTHAQLLMKRLTEMMQQSYEECEACRACEQGSPCPSGHEKPSEN